MRPLDTVVYNSVPWTGSNVLALAWLCEMAAKGFDQDGKRSWADQLRTSAAKLRETAVNK